MGKRRITPAYVLFYILFLPDTWQILIGIVFALLLKRFAVGPDMAFFSRILVLLMLAAIGYTVSRIPGKWIAAWFRRLVLGR